MFVLGRLYVDFDQVVIPYTDIVIGLVTIIAPLFVGILIGRYLPKIAGLIRKTVKPLSYTFILVQLVFGSLTNQYMYVLMVRYWYMSVAGLALPALGMLCAYLIALVFRQGKVRAITIAIETAIQDVAPALLILIGSMSQPEGDLAAAVPMVSKLMSTIPLVIAWIATMTYTKCWKTGKCLTCGGPMDVDIAGDQEKEQQIESDGDEKTEKQSTNVGKYEKKTIDSFDHTNDHLHM